MKKKERSRFLLKLAKLIRDEKGQIILMFTIMVPVLMGVIGLSLEVGRVYLLHSQLQEMADAAALAGAKLLDGSAGARDNAKAAARAVSNPNWWAEVIPTTLLPDAGFFFYARLNPDLEATSDLDAYYVKVTTSLHGIAPAFLTAVGAVNTNQTRATATAANLPVVCNVQPLMMCNPLEPDGKDFYEEFTNPSNAGYKPGVEFHMKVKGSQTPGGDGNSWAPGDFGLLDPPGLNSSGANLIRNLLSSQTPQFCYASNMSPRTGGAVGKVSDGLNTRFDMPVNGNQTGLDRTPAPNIIRGLYQQNCNNNTKYNCTTTFQGQGSSCSPLPANATVPMPEDAPAGQTTIGNMIKGNGTLDTTAANDYWNRHYGPTQPTWPTTGATLKSRYQAYRQELGLDGQTAPTLKAGAEQRDPLCTTPGSTDPDRRIINVAIVDCLAQNVHGNSPIALRPTAYAKMFLFRPSWNYANMSTSTGDVWAELVDVVPIDHTLTPPRGYWVNVLVRDHCEAPMLGCP